MLMSMQHAYSEAYLAMPNEERLDKVEESMENLEEVAKERNRAYYQLECGVTGNLTKY
jgi:large subunit ribosomal protein L47